MHLLKEGGRLVVVAYHYHSCSTLAFVVKDPQHNLQDIIRISIYIETYTHTISFGNWNRFWYEFSMLLFWKYVQCEYALSRLTSGPAPVHNFH